MFAFAFISGGWWILVGLLVAAVAAAGIAKLRNLINKA
jgi:hypothetical protein